MIDILIGFSLLFLGVIWLIYVVRNLEKWNEPIGWTVNYKGIMGSLMLMCLGLAFIFGSIKLSMLL